VLFGLVGGLTDSRSQREADTMPSDGEDAPLAKPWWKLDEEHYGNWNAHQLREQHRIGWKHCELD
jgi:hypothetical protein